MTDALLAYLDGLKETQNGLELLRQAEENIGESGFLNHSSKSQSAISLYSALRHEIHDFLCTKSKKYEELRNSTEKNSRAVVAFFAALAASHMAAPTAIASSMAAVTLFVPLKIGISAFCRAYSTSPNEMTRLELDVVKTRPLSRGKRN